MADRTSETKTFSGSAGTTLFPPGSSQLGTFTVPGSLIINNDLTVQGNILINNSTVINGNLLIDNNLKVDGTFEADGTALFGSAVSIVNASPLNVGGPINVGATMSGYNFTSDTSGNIVTKGTFSGSGGNATIDISGNTVFHGNLANNGTLLTGAGNLTVDSSGNLVVGGTSSLIGNVVTSNNLTVDGNILNLNNSRIEGTLEVDGTSLFGNSISIVNGKGISMGGNLSVTGISALVGNVSTTNNVIVGGTLGVTGTTSLTGIVSTTNDLNIGGNLNVNGTSNLIGTVTTTANAIIGTNLSVGGTSTLTGNVTTTNNLQVGGTLNVTGNTVLSGTLTNNAISLRTWVNNQITSATGVTITAANTINNFITRSGFTAVVTDTLDTAAHYVSAIPGVTIYQSFTFFYYNSSSLHSVVIAAGTGGLICNGTITTNIGTLVTILFTNVTPGSEAYIAFVRP